MSLSMYGNTNLLTTLAYEEELEETLNTMVMLSSFLKKTAILKELKDVKLDQQYMTKWIVEQQIKTNTHIINTMTSINKFESLLKNLGVSYNAPKHLIFEWDKMCSRIGKFNRLDFLYKSDYIFQVYDAIKEYRDTQIGIVAAEHAKGRIDLDTFQKFSARQREIGYYHTAVLLYNQKDMLNIFKSINAEYIDEYKKKLDETDKMIESINKELAKLKGYATIIMIKQLGKGIK